MPVNHVFIRPGSIALISAGTSIKSKQWIRFLEEAEHVEHYYSSALFYTADELQQFGNLIDEHYKINHEKTLSIYDWSLLQVATHSKIIKMKRLMQENDELRRKYTLLLREIAYLKEKRKAKGISRHIFYS